MNTADLSGCRFLEGIILMSKFVIQGRLDSLNEYTRANRSNKYQGASLKSENEKKVIWAILEAGVRPVDKYPVELNITWYEENRRRDIDNIVFATKFIQDAFVSRGIIEDDSQRYINKLSHTVKLDRQNPRIEVEIRELE